MLKEGFAINTKTNKKHVHIKSAVPIYAAALVFLLWGLFSPIYRGIFIFLQIVSSVAVYFVVSHFVPGRIVEVEEKTSTGDAEIDRLIEEGRETVKRLREAAQVMGDERLKNALTRISNAGEGILNETLRDESERRSIYTFLSYYLPTVEKLMSNYVTFAGAGENVQESRARIEDSLDMVAQAFEKQLDKMYRNEAVDVKTDIAVMEAMLKGEGLVQNQGK